MTAMTCGGCSWSSPSERPSTRPTASGPETRRGENQENSRAVDTASLEGELVCLAGAEPTPEFARRWPTSAAASWGCSVTSPSGSSRLRMEGYSNKEVASQLGPAWHHCPQGRVDPQELAHRERDRIMTPRTPERTALPLAVLDQIDRICDRFEAAWEAGEPPRIEEVLGQIAEAYRPALLRDLLAAELHGRRRLGEQPTPAEYAARCPEHAGRISDVFLDLELCETPKTALANRWAAHPTRTLAANPPELPAARNGWVAIASKASSAVVAWESSTGRSTRSAVWRWP